MEDFKQLVMNETDAKYQEMLKGTTLAPLSKSVSVLDSSTYSQKRNNYLKRLQHEMAVFCATQKQITKMREDRLKREKQRSLERLQSKDKAAVKNKLIFFWIVVVSLIAVNFVLGKNVFDIFLNSFDIDTYNDIELMNVLSTVWSALWPSWAFIAASLLTTAILGRKLLKGKNASLACFIEVGASLVSAPASLVTSSLHYENPVEEFIAATVVMSNFWVLLYVLPVGVSGAVSLFICKRKLPAANVSSGRASTTYVPATGTPKSKGLAFMLCLLLGCLGAHKFYEGKYGMGILYLFTFGLAGIGVIVDLFLIWNKSDPYYVE